MPKNGQNRGERKSRQSIEETKSLVLVNPRVQQREDAHTLAMLIGIRPAARKLGLNENTVLKWAREGKWEIPNALRIAHSQRNPLKSNALTLRDAVKDVMKEQGETTRLYASAMALRAFYAAGRKKDVDLLDRDFAIAMHHHAKTADIMHGYSVSGPIVAVQFNVTESDKLRERFALDVQSLKES